MMLDSRYSTTEDVQHKDKLLVVVTDEKEPHQENTTKVYLSFLTQNIATIYTVLEI
jgi:hypothetical protein